MQIVIFISYDHTKGALCETFCTKGALSGTPQGCAHQRRPTEGETLFTSMLSAYYDIKEADQIESLFKGTYIFDHPTKERNHYYILRLDFSGLNTSNVSLLEEEIEDRVFDNCTSFLRNYQINITLERRSAAGIMSQLLSSINLAPLYIIIDEYTQCAGWCDHFANELLSFTEGAQECRLDDFHHAVSKNGYVRKFYTLRTHGVKYCAKGALGENRNGEWYHRKNLYHWSVTNHIRFNDIWIGAPQDAFGEPTCGVISVQIFHLILASPQAR